MKIWQFGIGLVAGVLSVASQAQEVPGSQSPIALGIGQVTMRAGPGANFPVVFVSWPAAQFIVNGCVTGYVWCDVSLGVNRGWVYGGDVVVTSQGFTQPLLNNRANLGIGIVGFDLAPYWNSYYVGKPWYQQLGDWVRRYPSGGLPAAPQTPGYGPGYQPGYPSGNAPGYPPGYRPGYPQGNTPGYGQRRFPPGGPQSSQ